MEEGSSRQQAAARTNGSWEGLDDGEDGFKEVLPMAATKVLMKGQRKVENHHMQRNLMQKKRHLR
jgi:hypothetical protein